jgi:hypothetical protein
MGRLLPADLARFVLDRHDRALGLAGRAAVAAEPGLLALLDQHTTAVLDLLDPHHRRPTLTGLASYADGLVDTALGLGWTMPGPAAADWRRADTVTWRLVAACALAATRPALPR